MTAATPAANEDTAIDSCHTTSYGEGRPLPVPYMLCRFPDDVQRLLDAADPALATNYTYRNKIRKVLCDDIAQYTL